MSIFLCYSRKDETAVEALALGLEAARREVWFDHDLGGGDAWWDKIIENIRRCRVFVFALSDDALQSKPCRDEIAYARATGRPILPVQVGPVTSLRHTPFADVQAVAFRPDNARAGFEVIAAVDQVAERVRPLPDPLPPPPPIPFGYLHAIGRQIDAVELDPTDQLKVVDQLRRALGEETDHTVRRDVFAMLDNLMRKPWSTRRTEKEIRAVMFAWDTTSLVTMSPGLEAEMALARGRAELDQPQPGAVNPPEAEPSGEEAEAIGPTDAVDEPAAEAPDPGPRPSRRRRVWPVAAAAASGLVAGLLIGLAVAPGGGASTGGSAPGAATGPGAPGLPASAALPEDEMVVPVRRAGVWQLDLANTHAPTPISTLLRRTEDSRFPVLSPDRRTMIYVAYAGDKTSLRVAAADGSGDRPLFATAPRACADKVRRPAWNPIDASLLAISCRDSSNRWTLNLVRTDGTVTGKVDTDELRTGDPTWNSDGSKLAFWATPPTSDVEGGALYLAKGDGSHVEPLTHSNPGVDADPAWNPVGLTVAFRRHRASGADEIWEVPGTGNGVAAARVVNGAKNSDPAWSLSGRSLAYVSDAPVPDGPPGAKAVQRIWVSQDGAAARLLWATDDEQNAPAWTRR